MRRSDMSTILEWLRRIIGIGIWQFLSKIGLKAVLGLIFGLALCIAVIILLVVFALSLLF
jgi:uncharacterized membrane protein (Fun14 family)